MTCPQGHPYEGSNLIVQTKGSRVCRTCLSEHKRRWRLKRKTEDDLAGRRVADLAAISRDAWLELRQQGIGGSEAAAIAGLDRYKSPLRLYMEKVGEIPPEESGEAAAWGVRLEAVVRDHFVSETGLLTIPQPGLFRHPDHPWMLATPDGVTVDTERRRGIFEAKTTSARAADHWEDGQMPERWLVQVHQYMAVLDCDYAWIAVLVGGQRYHQERIERDDELIRHLIGLEGDFWGRVERRDPPPADGSNATSDVLKLLYPAEQPDTRVVLPDDARGLIGDYEAAHAAEKHAKGRKDAAANAIRALLKDAEAGYLDGEVVATWKQATRRTVDTKRLQAERPEIHKEYLRESSFRQLRVTGDAT